MLTKIRNKLLTIFGDIKVNKHFPWIPYYKPEGYKIRGEQVRVILRLIEPGDVLVRGFDDYLDGYFIGHWSHVGLVFDKDTIIHSIAEGVIKEDILNFLRTDRIMILRPNLYEQQKRAVILRGLTLVGTKYDFGFNFDDPKEMSCTEFVYNCFLPFEELLGMHKSLETFVIGKKSIVRPESFMKFSGFQVVWISE